jgi:hypothetical protein
MYFLRIQLDKHQNMRRRSLLSCNLCVLATLAVLLALGTPVLADATTYGPENMLKTLPTPFSLSLSSAQNGDNGKASSFDTLSLDLEPTAPPHRSLRDRFNSARLFLPERMTIGKSCEFLIKGEPGSYAAIAMADKNKGAKPVFGHTLRLGPDRKLVGVGQIPDTGVLSLFVEAPIQGDLIGAPMYFEAGVWTKADFSDLQIAIPASPQIAGGEDNAVIIAGESDPKKNKLFVFDQSRFGKQSAQPGGLNTGVP